MKLTQKEQERLSIFTVAEISRRRWKRGIKLNYIEATAIICDELLERAREGKSTLAHLVQVGAMILTEEDVMEGTAALVPVIQLEVMLPDGNKLLSVQDPIRLERRAEAIPIEELISVNYEGGSFI
ncbi:MAG: urease subunit gamma [Clostridia bacterium]|nr:urease subunit gamma [Clostridia bacterium]